MGRLGAALTHASWASHDEQWAPSPFLGAFHQRIFRTSRSGMIRCIPAAGGSLFPEHHITSFAGPSAPKSGGRKSSGAEKEPDAEAEVIPSSGAEVFPSEVKSGKNAAAASGGGGGKPSSAAQGKDTHEEESTILMNEKKKGPFEIIPEKQSKLNQELDNIAKQEQRGKGKHDVTGPASRIEDPDKAAKMPVPETTSPTAAPGTTAAAPGKGPAYEANTEKPGLTAKMEQPPPLPPGGPPDPKTHEDLEKTYTRKAAIAAEKTRFLANKSDEILVKVLHKQEEVRKSVHEAAGYLKEMYIQYIPTKPSVDTSYFGKTIRTPGEPNRNYYYGYPGPNYAGRANHDVEAPVLADFLDPTNASKEAQIQQA